MYTRKKFIDKVKEISEQHNILNLDEINRVSEAFDCRVKHKEFDMSGKIDYVSFSPEYHEDGSVRLKNFFYYVTFDVNGIIHGKGADILTACRKKHLVPVREGFELV